MSCPNCQNTCNTGECGCIPQGLTTPNYCPSDSPTCPDPIPCSETFDSACIYYTGADITCYDITTGTSVEEVITTLATALSPFVCIVCPTMFSPATTATGVSLTPTLIWNNVLGATSYDVYFGTNVLSLTLVSTDNLLNSYTISTPLINNTVYYWKVIPKRGTVIPAIACTPISFTTIV